MSRIVDISEALLVLGLSTSCTNEERAITLFCITHAEGDVRRFLGYDPVYATRTEYYPLMDHAQGHHDSVWEVTATQAYERRVSQGSANKLQLKHVPVRSITSLKIDYDGRSGTQSGAFGAETAKVEGTDFWPNYDMKDSSGNRVCRDGILNSVGLWPMQPGSVQVEYYAGYSVEELHGQDSVIDASPLWVACLDEIQRRVMKIMSRKKNRIAGFVGPLASEHIGDYSYTANTALLTSLIGGGSLMSETQEKLNEFVNYGAMLG
jgi:hypothetical protein